MIASLNTDLRRAKVPVHLHGVNAVSYFDGASACATDIGARKHPKQSIVTLVLILLPCNEAETREAIPSADWLGKMKYVAAVSSKDREFRPY